MAESLVPHSVAIAVGHALEAGTLDHEKFDQER